MLRYLVPASKMTEIRNKNARYFQKADRITGYFEKPVIVLIIVAHLIYFFIFANLFINDKTSAMKFAKYSNEFAEFIIAAYLIIRFNPFREYEFNQYDATFSFWGGIFLLMSLSVTGYIENYIANIPVVHNTYNYAMNKIDNISSEIHQKRAEISPTQQTDAEQKHPTITATPHTTFSPIRVANPVKTPDGPHKNPASYSDDVTLINENDNKNNNLEYSPFDADSNKIHGNINISVPK